MRSSQDINPLIQVPRPALRVREALGYRVFFVERDEAVPRLDVAVVPGGVLDGAVGAVEGGVGDDLGGDVETEVCYIRRGGDVSINVVRLFWGFWGGGE